MSATVFPEICLMPPATQTAAKPESAQVAGLQEQYSGPLPLRSERSMAEILVERLAEADPDSPCPVFIP